MNKLLPVLLLLLFSQSVLAQPVFEPATYKDNDGNIIEGFIKNLDWRSNPTEFDFKSSLENSNFVTLTISEVIEFEIIDYGKFVRSTVEVDRSTEDKTKLSISTTPEFNTEIHFLKLLIEGDASLYSYQEGNFIRYFFSTEQIKTTQLIYRLYKSDDMIVFDNSFKKQLLTNLLCSEFLLTDFQILRYNRKDLLNHFVQYFDCNNLSSTIYTYKRDFKRLIYSVKTGISISSIDFTRRTYFRTEGNLQNGLGFTLLGELEFKLPFNNGKISALLEPGIQVFSADAPINYVINANETDTTTVNVNYKSILLPLGVRYHLLNSNKSNLYLSTYFGFDFPFQSEFTVGDELKVLIDYSTFFKVGLGFKYNQKFIFETNWRAPGNIATLKNGWIANFSSIQFILGYTF